MNIDQKEFNKLSQLDRIEFRQKYENILNNTSYTLNIEFLVLFMLLVVIGSAYTYYITGDTYSAKETFSWGYIFIFMFLFIDIALYFASLLKRKRQINELEKEYFKAEVHKKR